MGPTTSVTKVIRLHVCVAWRHYFSLATASACRVEVVVVVVVAVVALVAVVAPLALYLLWNLLLDCLDAAEVIVASLF